MLELADIKHLILVVGNKSRKLNTFKYYKFRTTSGDLLDYLKQQYRGFMVNKIVIKLYNFHIQDYNHHQPVSEAYTLKYHQSNVR